MQESDLLNSSQLDESPSEIGSDDVFHYGTISSREMSESLNKQRPEPVQEEEQEEEPVYVSEKKTDDLIFGMKPKNLLMLAVGVIVLVAILK